MLHLNGDWACIHIKAKRLLKHITSTFFNSNSELWAKHKFPNVSHGPLVPLNLFQAIVYNCNKWICKYFTIWLQDTGGNSKESIGKELTDLHPSIKHSYHHPQELACHSNTCSNTCWLLCTQIRHGISSAFFFLNEKRKSLAMAIHSS